MKKSELQKLIREEIQEVIMLEGIGRKILALIGMGKTEKVFDTYKKIGIHDKEIVAKTKEVDKGLRELGQLVDDYFKISGKPTKKAF